MEKKLLLQELSDIIAAREHITKKKAETFVRAFFEVIEEGLLTDNFVKIKGFGTFKLIAVSERESVNINTGERFQIDGHSKISFLPDNNLKDLVNRPFSHFQTVVINDETDIEELESVENEPMPTILETPTQEAEEAEPMLEEMVETEDETKTISEEAPPQEEETEEQVVIPTPIVAEEETEDTATEMPKEIPFEIYQPSEEEENLPAPSQETEDTVTTEEEEPEQPTDESPITLENVSTETENKDCQTKREDTPESAPAECEDEPCEEEESTCKWWKKLLLIIGILLLMTGSYFAGYFRLLCPCEIWPSAAETAPQKTAEQAAVPSKVEQDSLQAEPQEDKQEKQGETPDAMPQSNKPDTEKAQPESVTAQKKSELSESAAPIPIGTQVKDGRYIITGTRQNYTISRGETLRTIAERFYGSRGYATYIIAHNDIQNPDHVDVGTVIKLPVLEKAKN